MRRELKAYPINYFVNPVDFAKKYAKNCVTFTATANPQDGVMHLIYQISPTFHVLARLFHWVEHDEVRAYLMLTCAYQKHEDFLSFFDDNKSLRLVGNTEDRITGFVGPSGGDGLANLMRGLATSPKNSDEDDDNPEKELNR
jgi:hypothetical protein